MVTDYSGPGPPGPEVAVQETAADFATVNPNAHGYTMLGLLAGTFDPGRSPTRPWTRSRAPGRAPTCLCAWWT